MTPPATSTAPGVTQRVRKRRTRDCFQRATVRCPSVGPLGLCGCLRSG